MRLPGLMPWLSAIQPAIVPWLLGRMPAPSVCRDPTWVRSGPARPLASVPRIVWHAPQPEAVNTTAPGKVDAAAGAACFRRHAAKSAGAWATTTSPIRAWGPPQYSAHWPA
ncbi:hypothetical protein D3C80_899150 [compost metagenome]